MMPLLLHMYRFAEVYTVVLAWIVIPLFYYAVVLFYRQHPDLILLEEKASAPVLQVLPGGKQTASAATPASEEAPAPATGTHG